MGRFVRSASLTGYREVASAAGLDSHAMLAEFGLPAACLGQTDLKLPVDAVRGLLEASAERTNLEGFALLMAEKRRLAHLGPVGLLLREQPTLRHALEALARYANRMNNAMFLTLQHTSSVCLLRGELITGGEGPARQSTELVAAVVFLSLREVLGEPWSPLRVFFAHAAPADLTVHRRVFGDAVVFGQDLNGISWPRDRLDVPNRQADPILARYARDLVNSTFTDRGLMTDQVRELVLTQLASGRTSIDAAAHQLGLSRRTMHRQLLREGHSFSGIVDDVRRELASRYLADKHRTLAEISELLGFAAPSGFSRWHRRNFKDTASRKRVKRARA